MWLKNGGTKAELRLDNPIVPSANMLLKHSQHSVDILRLDPMAIDKYSDQTFEWLFVAPGTWLPYISRFSEIRQ